VSLRRRLRNLIVCIALECGVLSGVPIQARELKELLERLNQATLAHVLPSQQQDGDGPSEPDEDREGRAGAGPGVRLPL
jgi:hypothetical protein